MLVCLALLWLGVAPAAAREPVRVLVISNVDQLLQDAFVAFETAHGKGLIQLEVVSEEVAPERLADADVIVAYMLKSVHEQRLTDAIAAAQRRGAKLLVAPATLGQLYWKVKVDRTVNDPVVRYWNYGGLDNMTALLAHVYTVAGGSTKLRVPPPVPQLDRGIYHPKAAEPFPSLQAYLDWYRGQRIVPREAPLVGVTFFSTNWKFHDVDHVDALIAAFEKRGIGVVAAFDWPLGAMEDLLAVDGVSPLRVLFTLNQSMAPRPEDPVLLDKLGVHAINLMATRQSQKEWEDDPRGVPVDRVRNLYDLPEGAGVTEPILFSTLEPLPGSAARVSRAVPERLEAIVQRTLRWIALQDKANKDKRIAFVYYNHPPGKGSIGADYLAVFPTLRNILQRLQQAGYATGTFLPDEQRLIDLLESGGRNIELWSPGELEDMVDRGAVTLLPMAQYKTWFAQLPRRFRDATIARWGQPETSTLMTVTRDGARYFVVPGRRFGNIFVGPQPLRSTFEEYQNTGHDTVTPVPHQYVAAYLWYRHQFKADAIVHVGRHGTLEWLPGKQTAQAGWDASEVLLGDVPDPYYYIVDGDGEAIQAKRRGAAVIISHLTPMIVNGGELPEFKELHDALENLEKTEGTSANLAEEYRKSAMAEIRRLKLDAQLGMSLETMPWEDVEERVHRFLHDIEGNTLPLGLHTIGEAPPEQNQREGLAAFLKYAFEEREAALVAGDVQAWADAIFAGQTPEIAAHYSPELCEKIRKTFDEGRAWVENIRVSPAQELDSLITILAGRHVSTAPFGNPLQVAASVPTGRNEHASDTALIPTRAAWNVGRKMADEFITTYRAQHKAYPDKVSQVLWGGETLRHQGAFESMGLALLGVEPVWNARGVVDSVQLIPDAELGRPRVDVVFSVSGSYRDVLADKVLLLDRAVRLAAAAGDNVISRHDREVAATLRARGIAGELADQIGRARVFSNKPGAYGVGVQQMVEQSRDADGHTEDLANLYMHYTNFAYSSELWGGTAEGALAGHLTGNQAVLFSRTSSLYGALDNDDVYQYFGGLSLASKTVNGGAAPDMFIHNLRKSGSESMTDLKGWLASELNARNWNPKWLTEMQRSGYAGAREMAKSMEHLYGFQATTVEQMDGTFWQNSYDVLVADKHGLDMDRFFQEKNPYAQQSILARMLEVDRQGSYKFSDADRETLVRKYVESVARNGVNCTANTCGNLKVSQFIAEQAGLIEGLGQEVMQRFGQRVASATGWTPRDFASAPTAITAGMRAAAAAQAPPLPPTPAPAPAPPPDVSGFKLEEQIRQLASPANADLSVWPFVAMALAILFGIFRERARLTA